MANEKTWRKGLNKIPTKTTAKKKTEKMTTGKNETPEAEPIEKKATPKAELTEPKQQASLFGVLCDVQDTVTKRARSNSESSVDETHPDKLTKVATWNDYENRLKSL
jgi:hypothetical protein